MNVRQVRWGYRADIPAGYRAFIATKRTLKQFATCKEIALYFLRSCDWGICLRGNATGTS